MRQENLPAIPLQAAASIAFSINSVNLVSCSVQFVATGSAAGTLILQASNDPLVSGPTNWTTITGTSTSVSGAGTYLIPKTDLCYEFIQVVYTNSGTGTMAAQLKTLGA